MDAVPNAERLDRLQASIESVRQVNRDMAAHPLMTKAQRNFLIGIVLLAVAGLVLFTAATAIALLGVITFVYLLVLVNRSLLFVRSRRAHNMITVTDEEALAVSDDDLPMYTVLVPAYKEPEVIGRLIEHLEHLDYPRHKLDVQVLLEEDDLDTILLVNDLEAAPYMEAVVVPPGGPRTKPKALNYGLGLARGEIVTIYDAEDQPDPLQLRRAAVAIGRGGDDLACVQAKLSFSNVGQNLITKWFTIEYDMWFNLFLPGLVESGAPVPLGGTSNHFRRDVLEELGAWDPHNVTEDADLGLRLARYGYRCEILDSVTLEEANSDFVNWVKQRSRWYKGYLQTLLIHMRHPIRTYRQLGHRGFTGFLLFVGGTPILAFLNPLFWLMTAVWFAGGHLRIIHEIFPATLFYPAMLCWVFGNFTAAYLTVLACRLTGRTDLLLAAVLMPLYWVMMAIAAAKAMWQLLFTPSYWEKTTHGLDRQLRPAAATNPG